MIQGRIHPTAFIEQGAVIHPTCEVGPYCIIRKNVRLGPNNKLFSHVVMENHTTVGEGNLFYPFSVIGGAPQDLKYRGEPSTLEIGNQNTFRENVTVNIGTEGGGGVTRIGNHNLLMAYVHIGHDTIVENHAILANACQIAGHVFIDDHATLGGSTAVSQFIRIGKHVYIGGLSGIDRDVPPYVLGRGISGSFEILGINLVGLKRRGFSDEDLALLKELNRLYFKDKTLEKEAALRRVEEILGNRPVIGSFVNFVRLSEKGSYR